MVPIGNHFGYIGGVSWLVILLTLVFLGFILATVCAKKDSWVRAMAYTMVRLLSSRALFVPLCTALARRSSRGTRSR